MIFTKFAEMYGADLLLSFNHKFDVTREVVVLCHYLESLDMHIHLSFIIARSPCKDSAFRMLIRNLYNRLKWW